MVMIEVDIVLRPSTFLHIIMMEYARSTQGSLKMIVKGKCKEKNPKQSSRLFVISISKSSLLFLYMHATTPSSKHDNTP